MIDFRTEHHEMRFTGTLALTCVSALLAIACASPAQVPDREILLPLARTPALQPTDADLASRDLIRAALLSDRAKVIEELEDLEEVVEEDGIEDRDDERLVPLGQDLASAASDDIKEYRKSCRKLHHFFGGDPRLKQRLKQCIEDDPLRLARRRVWDVRESLWADTYNAIAEPLSRSLLTGGVLSPYYLASSAASYLAKINERDPFPVQLKQALAHRERFLRRHPDAPEAPDVLEQVEKARAKYDKVQSNALGNMAEDLVERGSFIYALHKATEAVERKPDNKKAHQAIADARAGLRARDRLRERSEGASEALLDLDDPEATRFNTSLLDPDADLDAATREFLLSKPTAELADAGRFTIATLQSEAGHEDASWALLERIANQGPEDSAMARHAWTLMQDSSQNPYGSFLATARHQKFQSHAWTVFGPFANGPRLRRIPKAAAWAFDLPAIVNTALSTPFRLIFSPVTGKRGPDFDKNTAVAAYRYLDLRPDGEHDREVMSWLYDYERKRKNWSAALKLADYLPTVNGEERSELVELAAEQQLAYAARERQRDKRDSILRHVAREFPDSAAGHAAGVEVRELLLNASAQKIRMTRGFLVENPQVSGPQALGIHPELIDGKNHNGELHPRGVTFIGGRTLEFEFLDPSGDEEMEPHKLRRDISGERLSRLIAVLEDTIHRNMRVDSDDDVAADARRDYYFERAKLGVTEKPDRRASAQSTYVFESMRERYGMVRGRESILPFDIVVRGDITNLGISAFPRWRKPRETPDAFLYR